MVSDNIAVVNLARSVADINNFDTCLRITLLEVVECTTPNNYAVTFCELCEDRNLKAFCARMTFVEDGNQVAVNGDFVLQYIAVGYND